MLIGSSHSSLYVTCDLRARRYSDQIVLPDGLMQSEEEMVADLEQQCDQLASFVTTRGSDDLPVEDTAAVVARTPPPSPMPRGLTGGHVSQVRAYFSCCCCCSSCPPSHPPRPAPPPSPAPPPLPPAGRTRSARFATHGQHRYRVSESNSAALTHPT